MWEQLEPLTTRSRSKLVIISSKGICHLVIVQTNAFSERCAFNDASVSSTENASSPSTMLKQFIYVYLCDVSDVPMMLDFTRASVSLTILRRWGSVFNSTLEDNFSNSLIIQQVQEIMTVTVLGM